MPTKQEQHDQVEKNLTNHPPVNQVVVESFEDIRQLAKDLSHHIVEATPQSREQSLALTHIEQATMWAVAAIARNQ